MEHLPAGCAFARVLGGAGALSDAAVMAREIEYTIRAVAHGMTGSKGERPERIALPKPASTPSAEDRQMSAKARAWAARQARTSDAG